MPSKIDLSRLISELEKQGSCKLAQLPLRKELLVPESEVKDISKVLKQLSEPSKLKILLLLYYNNSLPVCIISRALGLDQTLVSHHLKTLKASGLVEYKRIGKYKLYKLTNYTAKIAHIILETLLKQAPPCGGKAEEQ